ncbi:hypothetical protein JCM5353_007746 [Sporobolomyces roseus]
MSPLHDEPPLIHRYRRFARTMIKELRDPKILKEFDSKMLEYAVLDKAERMDAQQAFSIKGIEVRLNYEAQDNDQRRIHHPVQPFSRLGVAHDANADIETIEETRKIAKLWKNRYLLLQLRPRVIVFSGLSQERRVELPEEVAFPRYLRLRSSPEVRQDAQGRMLSWKRGYNYYDGKEHDGLYETWEQLEVAVCDPSSVYDESHDHVYVGRLRLDGMLTSPSVTYLKLRLWDQPPAQGHEPVKTVLFLVHIKDQFIGRVPPIPRNLVAKASHIEHSHGVPTH